MQYGEIINLGRHRLMCGDATDKASIERLVGSDKIDLILTDPPYGVKVQHKTGEIGGLGVGTHYDFRNPETFRTEINYPQIIGDDTTQSAKEFFTNTKDFTNKFIIWGGQYFTDFLPPSGGWIFWDKQRPNELDFGAGELAWNTCSRVVKKYEQKSNGCITVGSVSLNPRPRVHPTQKPVELHARILEDFSKPGDIVLDAFGGSGTTLIACEITGRTCLMMGISPEYCDIIKARYEKLTEGNLPLEWKRESE